MKYGYYFYLPRNERKYTVRNDGIWITLFYNEFVSLVKYCCLYAKNTGI